MAVEELDDELPSAAAQSLVRLDETICQRAPRRRKLIDQSASASLRGN